MAVSKKNGCLLAAVTASLSLGNVSAENSHAVEEFFPMASFLSAESCAYSIDYEIERGIAEMGKNGSA